MPFGKREVERRRLRSKAAAPFALVLAASLLIAGATTLSADEGIATWYGPGFHGNVMANGDVYDMYDPTTTASNIFPFGTWLKVTHLTNGKSVTVQVRDRGGFKHALDLSYAAFALLDDPKKMVIPIRYEVVPGPEAEKKEPPQAPPQPGPAPAEPAASPTPAPPKSPSNPPEAGSVGPTSNQTSYIVAPGDTLTRIAARFGVTAKALVEINGLANADSILIGQAIKLREDQPARPTSSRAGPSSGAQKGQADPEPKLHVVEAGETLSSIAALYDTTIQEIQALNDISSPDLIRIGDKLRVSQASEKPDPTVSASSPPRVHTVESGETLSEIALHYGLSAETLAELNGLSDANQIVVGQELRLEAESTGSSVRAAQASKEHTVAAGDTLFGIALEYGTSVEAIVSLNALSDADFLMPGQVLRLP